jgi:phosphoribosylaminoimidazole carboxylase (NCAIR synthetase)
VRAGLQALAETYVRGVLERLEYVGVLAVEFFVQGETLLANEMAPRVHNSGHWTIEGAETSQFANHLRAIAGQGAGQHGEPAHGDAELHWRDAAGGGDCLCFRRWRAMTMASRRAPGGRWVT